MKATLSDSNEIPRREYKQRSDTGIRRTPDGEPPRRKKESTYAQHRFIAWDGEGGTVDGLHRYQLFGNSDGLRISGQQLGWRDCFAALFAAPKDAIHVIFAGTYDLVKMVDHLPPEKLQRLLNAQPLFLGPYRVTYFRSKFLKITDRTRKETRTLYDVYTFFGTSFVKACRDYGLADRYGHIIDEIAAMKLQRSNFTVVGEHEQEYMKLELDLLVLLAERLRARLAAVGVFPASWHGPGAVAATILKKQRISEARGKYDEQFRRKAEHAYYGGRFEQFQCGHYQGQVYGYDIRSAYPAAMSHLPDLSGVDWYAADCRSIREGSTAVSRYGLYRLRSGDADRTKLAGSPYGYLPWRSDSGTIYYPNTFVSGWYWGVEIPEVLYPYVREGFESDGDGLHARPFQFVGEMYERRARLKAEGRPEQLALKLALNSLYGKLAQSKGARLQEDGTWRYPSFHEPVWAGWITAATRAKLNDVLHKHPGKIIAVETDALYSTEPLDVDLGTGLGQWELTTGEGLIYLQSGVYYMKQEGQWKLKSRGFTAYGYTANDWLAYMKHLPQVPREGLPIAFTRFVTDWRRKDIGQWVPTLHHLSLDFTGSKRIHDPRQCHACAQGQSYAHSLHPLVVPQLATKISKAYPFAWTDPVMAKALEAMYETDEFAEDLAR